MANTIRIYAKCNELFNLDLLKDGKEIDTYEGYPLDIDCLCSNSEVEFEVDVKTGKILNWDYKIIKGILEEQFGELDPKPEKKIISNQKNEKKEFSCTIKVKKQYGDKFIAEGIYYSDKKIDIYQLKDKIDYFFDTYEEIFGEDFDDDCVYLDYKTVWNNDGITLVLDEDMPARIGKKMMTSIFSKLDSDKVNTHYKKYQDELDKESEEQSKKDKQESFDWEEKLDVVKTELMKYQDKIGNNSKFIDDISKLEGFKCVVKIHSFKDPRRYLGELFEKCLDLISNDIIFKLKKDKSDGREFVEIYVSDENTDKAKEIINNKYGKLIFF